MTQKKELIILIVVVIVGLFAGYLWGEAETAAANGGPYPEPLYWIFAPLLEDGPYPNPNPYPAVTAAPRRTATPLPLPTPVPTWIN